MAEVGCTRTTARPCENLQAALRLRDRSHALGGVERVEERSRCGLIASWLRVRLRHVSSTGHEGLCQRKLTTAADGAAGVLAAVARLERAILSWQLGESHPARLAAEMNIKVKVSCSRATSYQCCLLTDTACSRQTLTGKEARRGRCTARRLSWLTSRTCCRLRSTLRRTGL